MQKEEFESQLYVAQNKGVIIEAINNKEISIDWETDISKIDLRALRSFKEVLNAPDLQCIEMHDLSSLETDCRPLFYDRISQDDELIIELVRLMEKRVKIIPPIFKREVTIKNGVDRSGSMLVFRDGSHRIRIARALGLIEIPIITTIDYVYFYSLSHNSFKATDDGLVVTSEDYNHFYSFDQSIIDVKDDGVQIRVY